jgi:uncharacterized protein (TIGR00369 family)
MSDAKPDVMARLLDPRSFVEVIPYARFLGMEAKVAGNVVTTVLPFQDKLVGNPVLPALHGGVTGAFLELTATLQLIARMEQEHLPKPIDISIDYLRSGKALETYGRAFVTKIGRRVANVRAEAWQEDVDRPIATLHGHFLLKPSNGGEG